MSGRSLVQRSPTECGVSECDSEVSIMGRRWLSLRLLRHKKIVEIKKFFFLCLWVPVTTVRSVLRLRMEERGPILWVAANKLNKKLRTGDKGWSSSFGFGQGTNNSSPLKPNFFEYSQARCVLWRQNNPEVNYSPNRISGGEGGVFVEEASPNRKRKSEIL